MRAGSDLGQTLPTYEFTCSFAAFTPPTPEMQQLFGAIHAHPASMNAFTQMFAGVQSPSAFFSPANVQLIFAAAAEA